MSEDNDILRLFESTGAYLKGHFRLTSGLHSAEYMQSALVLRHPPLAEDLGRRLAARLKELAGSAPIDVVVSPALGGLIIGHEVARAMEPCAGRVDLGVPRVALATLDAISWTPEECPLCKQGLPVEKPGSRAIP